jgi:hypothetical protein
MGNNSSPSPLLLLKAITYAIIHWPPPPSYSFVECNKVCQCSPFPSPSKVLFMSISFFLDLHTFQPFLYAAIFVLLSSISPTFPHYLSTLWLLIMLLLLYHKYFSFLLLYLIPLHSSSSLFFFKAQPSDSKKPYLPKRKEWTWWGTFLIKTAKNNHFNHSLFRVVV